MPREDRLSSFEIIGGGSFEFVEIPMEDCLRSRSRIVRVRLKSQERIV